MTLKTPLAADIYTPDKDNRKENNILTSMLTLTTVLLTI